MIEKPDAGAIVGQKRVDISHEDTALTLFRKLEDAADALLAEILPRMAKRDIPMTPMDISQGSYYGGRRPEDGRIFWDRPAEEIYNLIRAVTHPYPGAFGFLGEDMVTFWRASPVQGISLEPGRMALRENMPLIGTGEGCLSAHEIEVNGRVLTGPGLQTYFKEHEGEVVQ
jgi:methionyl-tRNA formyltransferase